MPTMQELMTQYAPQSAPPEQPSMQDLMAKYQPQAENPSPSPFGSNRGVNIPAPSTVQPDLGEMAKSAVSAASLLPEMAGDIGKSVVQGATRLGGAAYTAAGGELSPEMAEALTNNPLPSGEETYKNLGIPVHQPQGWSGVFGQLLGQGGGVVAAEKAAPAIIDAAKAVPEGIALRAKGVVASSPEEMTTQSDKNWEDVANLFKSSSANGAVVNDASAQNIADKVRSAIGSLRSRHSDTAGTLSDFDTRVQKGGLTPEDLHDFRKDLNDVIKENTKSKIDGGGINEDGQKALVAKNALDEALSGLGSGDFTAGSPQAINDLQNAINSTAKAYRYDRVADMLKDAGGDPNAIMRGASRLLKNTNGMNNDEIAALNELATRGTGQAIERALGTFGFDLGKAKNIALPAITSGASAVVPGGIPLMATGTALRQTGKWAAKGKGQNLLDTIMERETAPAAPAAPAAPVIQKQGQASTYINPNAKAIPKLSSGEELPNLGGASEITTPIQGGAESYVSPQAEALSEFAPNEQLNLGSKEKPLEKQGQASQYFNPESGSASLAIPAAAGGAALAAKQLFGKPATGNIGNQNQDELKKLQFPQQPQEKPQSSLPDVSSFAKAESNNNPNAKNPNSTASGLYQFTNRTWNEMVKRYGKQTGINLGDKSDPKAQATMAALLAKDNIAEMQKTLGRLPTKGELYAAHVLGAHGATKLIQADPNQEAIMLYPRQVFDANHAIFFNGKRPRTVAEVQHILTNKVS